jgi:hypothetical protein
MPYLQREVQEELTAWSWIRKHGGSSNLMHCTPNRQKVTSQKTWIVSSTPMRTSGFVLFFLPYEEVYMVRSRTYTVNIPTGIFLTIINTPPLFSLTLSYTHTHARTHTHTHARTRTRTFRISHRSLKWLFFFFLSYLCIKIICKSLF